MSFNTLKHTGFANSSLKTLRAYIRWSNPGLEDSTIRVVSLPAMNWSDLLLTNKQLKFFVSGFIISRFDLSQDESLLASS